MPKATTLWLTVTPNKLAKNFVQAFDFADKWQKKKKKNWHQKKQEKWEAIANPGNKLTTDLNLTKEKKKAG